MNTQEKKYNVSLLREYVISELQPLVLTRVLFGFLGCESPGDKRNTAISSSEFGITLSGPVVVASGCHVVYFSKNAEPNIRTVFAGLAKEGELRSAEIRIFTTNTSTTYVSSSSGVTRFVALPEQLEKIPTKSRIYEIIFNPLIFSKVSLSGCTMTITVPLMVSSVAVSRVVPGLSQYCNMTLTSEP